MFDVHQAYLLFPEVLESYSESLCLSPYLEMFLLYFDSFNVSGLTLKSLVTFEPSFAYSERLAYGV